MDRFANMLASLAVAAITVFGISVASVDGINTTAISHVQLIARDDCDIVSSTAVDIRSQCSFYIDAASTADVLGPFCASSSARSKVDTNGFQVWSDNTNSNCYNLLLNASYSKNWDDMPFDATTVTHIQPTSTLIVYSRIVA